MNFSNNSKNYFSLSTNKIILFLPGVDSKCFRENAAAERRKLEDPLATDHVAMCNEDGSYATRQCDFDYSGHFCWCVDGQTGEEIQGTRTESGDQAMNLNCDGDDSDDVEDRRRPTVPG